MPTKSKLIRGSEPACFSKKVMKHLNLERTWTSNAYLEPRQWSIKGLRFPLQYMLRFDSLGAPHVFLAWPAIEGHSSCPHAHAIHTSKCLRSIEHTVRLHKSVENCRDIYIQTTGSAPNSLRWFSWEQCAVSRRSSQTDKYFQPAPLSLDSWHFWFIVYFHIYACQMQLMAITYMLHVWSQVAETEVPVL
jgi:hypothetical protein